MSLLAGRCVLVTGASGGIGAAVARLAQEEGARVAAADLPGRPTVPGALPLAGDLAHPSEVAALFAAYDARMPRLDALVHCAGIVRDGVLWKLSDEAWTDVIRTNLDAAFWVLREAAPRLRRQGGAVVLLTSINGERGKLGQANYAASKAGLIGLGRTAARELGRFDVRVNLIAPGLIDTPMTVSLPPDARQRAVEESVLGRVGTPEDVAQAAVFLLSDRARHIAGQVLRVDGGQLIG
jgi:acetoacetyl-CoA reductase/3-oxoacyl-[acyl-carrier protein] reductase